MEGHIRASIGTRLLVWEQTIVAVMSDKKQHDASLANRDLRFIPTACG
jgi:hypothetical protein